METSVKYRYALWYAVLAAAYTSVIDNLNDNSSKQDAFRYYSLALSALSESIRDFISGKDNNILITVVVLDIFKANISSSFISLTYLTN
jgi:hypothetical protein